MLPGLMFTNDVRVTITKCTIKLPSLCIFYKCRFYQSMRPQVIDLNHCSKFVLTVYYLDVVQVFEFLQQFSGDTWTIPLQPPSVWVTLTALTDRRAPINLFECTFELMHKLRCFEVAVNF